MLMRGRTPLVRVARDDVGGDRLLDRAEVVAVVEHAGLHAVPLSRRSPRGLAADVVVDAGGRHQVALVRGIDEHLGRRRSCRRAS